MPSFSKILLDILHSDAGRPNTSVFRDFTPEDWTAFIGKGIEYRLAFQVNEYIRADPGRLALVPEPCLGQLRDSIRSTSVLNFLQQNRLRQILLACQARNIALMLVKGLWLVETVYRGLGARSSGDIDLVVRPKDMPAFTQLAKELGFDVPANVGNLCDLAVANNEFGLAHHADGTFLDVHWLLMHPVEDRPIDEEALWRRSEVVSLAGVACRSLRLEDHILYICFHAAMHHRFSYVGPRALLDVANLIAQPPRPVDWDEVVQRAYELGWQRGAWLMFDLVREHLGVTPPKAVLLSLKPGREKQTDQVREVAIDMMFESQQQDELPRNLVRLMGDQPLREKFALLARRLFPSRIELASQFLVNAKTARLSWLYFRRWGLLIKSSLPQVLRLARGNPETRRAFECSRLIEDWVSNANHSPTRADEPAIRPQ